MLRILVRHTRAKLPMPRPNEADILRKHAKKGTILYLLYPNGLALLKKLLYQCTESIKRLRVLCNMRFWSQFEKVRLMFLNSAFVPWKACISTISLLNEGTLIYNHSTFFTKNPGGDSLPYEKVEDARQKIWIKPLKETKLSVARGLFDP